MQGRRVLCPGCGAMLTVPPGRSDCPVRCGCCRERFRLPPNIRVTDDAIVSWLQDEEEAEQAGAPAPAEQTGVPTDEPASGKTAVLPAIGGELRVVKATGKGALFEFPASKLLDPAFRCAMPRRCLRCGGRTHLRVHVVIYTPEFRDSLSLEAERSAGSLAFTDRDVRDLSNDELLERLSRVPNVPAPGDLPMPYWLCDLCAGAAAVSGQIKVNPDTHIGWCRLVINYLRRAEEFLINAGGADTASHALLRKCIATTTVKPWDSLPLVVQHRVEQWFHPAKGEKFVAYIPDRGRFRSEEGVCGVVVSSRRFIYHSQRRHHEVSVEEQLTLTPTLGAGKANLEIRAPNCQIKHFCVDAHGIRSLRRALAVGKFNVSWH